MSGYEDTEIAAMDAMERTLRPFALHQRQRMLAWLCGNALDQRAYKLDKLQRPATAPVATTTPDSIDHAETARALFAGHCPDGDGACEICSHCVGRVANALAAATRAARLEVVARVRVKLARPEMDMNRVLLDAQYARRIGATEHEEILALAIDDTADEIDAIEREADQ